MTPQSVLLIMPPPRRSSHFSDVQVVPVTQHALDSFVTNSVFHLLLTLAMFLRSNTNSLMTTMDTCIEIFHLRLWSCIGWCCSLPTDIQAEGIPMILGGGDVLMVRNGQLLGGSCGPVFYLPYKWRCQHGDVVKF